jgi:cytochrome c-type biogenesis protein CcmH
MSEAWKVAVGWVRRTVAIDPALSSFRRDSTRLGWHSKLLGYTGIGNRANHLGYRPASSTYATAMVLLILRTSAQAQVVLTPPPINLTVDQEKRASEINKGLRCVVCQNQSIDESNAPLAIDLRQLVRERLALGETDAKATQFIVQRYGNFVLLKPPFQFNTLLLWLGPLLLFGLSAYAFSRFVRRAVTEGDGIEGGGTGAASTPKTDAAVTTPALSADEEKRLANLLN